MNDKNVIVPSPSRIDLAYTVSSGTLNSTIPYSPRHSLSDKIRPTVHYIVKNKNKILYSSALALGPSNFFLQWIDAILAVNQNRLAGWQCGCCKSVVPVGSIECRGGQLSLARSAYTAYNEVRSVSASCNDGQNPQSRRRNDQRTYLE